MASPKVVVVGVDGSEPSREALRYALREANRRGATLRVVAAFQPPEYWAIVYGAPIAASTPDQAAAVRAEVQDMINEVLAELRVRVEVDLVVVTGSAVPALLDASAHADLLVLGHRGRGQLASAMLGSVGLQCAIYASCPVTIVRPAKAREHVDATAGERFERQPPEEIPVTVAPAP